MREGISIAEIFPFVILFILLFTGIMTYTINNANAFGIKDEIINIINLSSGEFLDENGNLNEEVVESMEANSYRNTGKCDNGFQGYDRNGTKLTSGNASVCIKCVRFSDTNEEIYTNDPNFEPEGASLHGYYYQVQVFYQLDIPVIKSSFNLKTNGESKVIYSKNYPTKLSCEV